MRNLFIVWMLLLSAVVSADVDELGLQYDTPSYARNAVAPQLEEHPIAMANLEGEPSAFVHQCVNVISGQYCDSKADLIIPHGVDPLVVERNFAGNSYTRGTLGPGWTLNHFNSLQKGKSNLGKVLILNQDHGGTLLFKNNNETDFPVLKECLYRGVTNTASGYISGQTNLKNYFVRHAKEGEYRLKTGAGGYKTYTLHSKETNGVYRPQVEKKASGNKFRYAYKRPNKTIYLDTVEVVNRADKCVNRLQFPLLNSETLKKSPTWKITAEDGRWVNYNFFKVQKDRHVLERVDRSDGPSEEYIYMFFTQNGIVTHELIKEKWLPENRFLHIDHFKYGHNQTRTHDCNITSHSDPRVERVKRLLAPAGTDATPVQIYEFIYDLTVVTDKKKPQKHVVHNGGCHVYNALGDRTYYLYNAQHRLTEVQKFDKKDKLYARERLFWGDNASSELTHLQTRALEDQHGRIVFARTYRYDLVGNVLEDHLYGNISGRKPCPATLEASGKLQSKNSECYSKTFVYSEDNFNLLLEESDGILTTTYQYQPGTNLLTAKFESSDEGISKRWFFFYNDDAAVTKEIVDDGVTDDLKDLSGVTERHITYFKQSESYPVAYPLVIEEKCLNLQTKKEELVHKVVNTYTKQGKIAKQEHYDNQNVLSHTLQWEYDHMGNVTKEIDALGRIIERRYDVHGNCIFEQGPRIGCHKKFAYDFMNRCIKEEEVHDDGITHAVSHRYDLASNRIASIDPYGNETKYEYDPFGRVSQITYPKVFDANRKLHCPKIQKHYDHMGNLKREIDASGFEIQKSYTVRGQLASVSYPDGTVEKKVYQMHGPLCETIAKNGTRTCYTNDHYGRPIKTEIFSADGKLLSTATATYSSFHVLTETDPMGIVTQYAYYPNGKLRRKQQGNSISTYRYDALGRISKTHQHYGDQPHEVVVKAQKYDLLDRIIEETTEDASGNILTKVAYTYDEAGNLTQSISYPQGKAVITTTRYNSHGAPREVIDALGNITRTICRYDYYNEQGQGVPYQEVIDPLGNVTVSIQDALGRTARVVRKNALGTALQGQEFLYDSNGNCCQITDTSPGGAKAKHQIITTMQYDHCNRLTACCEAQGTPEQKITKITYNRHGYKDKFIKADGTSLSHTYDALGRLAKLQSSDKTIHYIYHYDLNNNPIKVEDVVNQAYTLKKYDNNNCLSSEQLGHGLACSYRYDRLGRLVDLTLPDGSNIAYGFANCFMQSVKRRDSQGNELYTHTYDSFDLNGNLSKAHFIGKGGVVEYAYDILGRSTATTTAKWQEALLRYDSVGNLLEKSVNDGQETLSRYSYDELYQLTQEKGVFKNTYAMDAFYQRTKKNDQKHVYNDLHQLLNDTIAQYTYDKNGNLISEKRGEDTTIYTYDALNRLVTLENGVSKVVYTYDEVNRRLTKTPYVKDGSGAWQSGETTRYLYQGQNEIGVCEATGKITELRLLGLGKGAEIGAAIAMEVGAEVYIPIHDHSGSVAALLNMEGELIASYQYSAFGEENFEACLVPWRFF